jgi:DNA-directed RNA polymerase specialized sigma24 family protein
MFVTNIDPQVLDAMYFESVLTNVEPDGLSDELVAAVDRLPASLREIVEAVFWRRESVRSVARGFGLSRATVHSKLERAFELIKVDLTVNEGFGFEIEVGS